MKASVQVALAIGMGFASLACTSTPAPRAPVAGVGLLVDGPEPLRKESERAILAASYGVVVRASTLPAAASTPATPGADLEIRIASARGHYMNGGFEGAQRCAGELADPALFWNALAAGMRDTALRVLLWRTACDAIFQQDAAIADARVFASLEAELPAEASVIPVKAHELLGKALAEAETKGRRGMVVAARGSAGPIRDATVIIDGRRTQCRTECAVDLRPGDHWIRVERDGFSPAARVVRVEDAPAPSPFVFDLRVASPEEASRQWTQRYGGGAEPSDSAASLELLSLAVRARHFVFVKSEPVGAGVRFRAALTRDGKVAAREERADGDLGHGPQRAEEVVRDLLVKGRLVEDPSLLKKPLFWIVVAGITTATAVVVTAFVLRGEDHTLTTQVRGGP